MKPLLCAVGLMGIAFAAPALADNEGVLAVESTATALRPNRFVWDDRAAIAVPGPVTVVVSIPDQRAYVYRGRALVAASAVSTGKSGKATPVGTYQILQKKVSHKSNLYNDASMPFMQRLTWDGIAIHAGQNPGFPNSHGCIRVPAAFAQKLFEATKLGTTVMVTDEPADYIPPADLVPDEIIVDARAEAAG